MKVEFKGNNANNETEVKPPQKGAYTRKTPTSRYKGYRGEQVKKTDRTKLILGKQLIKEPNGDFREGPLAYHIPSPNKNEMESIYVKGPSGSGKTWAAFNIAGQSFFADGRTWIIFDTKGSYIGNNRQNYKFADHVRKCGLRTRGIPGSAIKIISPQLYIRMKMASDPNIVRKSMITDPYRIPFRLCNLPIMFELTNLNKDAQYGAVFNEAFKEIKEKLGNRISLNDLIEKFNQYLTENESYRRFKNHYDVMLQRIAQVGSSVIEENKEWSVVGKTLLEAITTGEPKWIVFTLSLSDNIYDPINFAMMTAVIEEIREFSSHARSENLDLKLGVMIDELHVFTDQKKAKNATTQQAIHDLLYFWGRTNRIVRLILTQFDDQLQKVFQDEISFNKKKTDKYHMILECKTMPEPGTAEYLNRITSSEYDAEKPLHYKRIKCVPPLFEIEDRRMDKTEWQQAAIRHLYEKK